VATGFDASYFSERTPTATKEITQESPKVDDSLMQDMDVNLPIDSDDSFKSDTPMPNIWSMDESHDEPEEETITKPEPIVSSSFEHEDDELEKPSFLRRLKKLRGQSSSDEKNDDSTPDKEQ
jgi:hypothetical protein